MHFKCKQPVTKESATLKSISAFHWKLAMLCLLFCVIGGLGVGLAFRLTGVQLVVVSGQSMEPTLFTGDHIIMTCPKTPEELVGNPVCWVKLRDGSDVIKRLIGYPGDIVDIIDGETFVNGELLMTRWTDCYDNCHFILNNNDYLFLGDNRSASLDGRYWLDHYVTFDQIKGFAKNSQLDSSAEVVLNNAR